MSSSSLPYFYTPHQRRSSAPLFVFLPGMDETGEDLMEIQMAGLEAAFDVRCFVIPPEHLTDWQDLSQHVIQLTQAELKANPRSTVYLCGESFGGCLALKVLLMAPQLFQRIILVNSASSFHRVWLFNFGSFLLPLTPQLLYDAASMIALPFLAAIPRLSPIAWWALWNAAQSAPKATAEQRLELLRRFEIDEAKLRQIQQPVLLMASEHDRLLPSVEEAHRLARYFPNSQVLTMPHSGHAYLAETDAHLLSILQTTQFLEHSSPIANPDDHDYHH